jgi:putative flippase GtrA
MTTGTIEPGGSSAGPVPPLRQRHPLMVQLSRYVVAGGVGTGVNALTFLLLRTFWENPLGANLVALVVSTLVSTEFNRRFTFENAEGPAWRQHAQTCGVVAFYAVYSSSVLMVLAATVENPTPLLESAVVAAASVLGGAARYLLLRFWVFSHSDRDVPTSRWGRTGRIVLAAVLGAALLLTSACGLLV